MIVSESKIVGFSQKKNLGRNSVTDLTKRRASITLSPFAQNGVNIVVKFDSVAAILHHPHLSSHSEEPTPFSVVVPKHFFAEQTEVVTRRNFDVVPFVKQKRKKKRQTQKRRHHCVSPYIFAVDDFACHLAHFEGDMVNYRVDTGDNKEGQDHSEEETAGAGGAAVFPHGWR